MSSLGGYVIHCSRLLVNRSISFHSPRAQSKNRQQSIENFQNKITTCFPFFLFAPSSIINALFPVFSRSPLSALALFSWLLHSSAGYCLKSLNLYPGNFLHLLLNKLAWLTWHSFLLCHDGGQYLLTVSTLHICFIFVLTVDADEIRRLGKRFRKLDLDNSGALSIDEFMSLPELQQNPLVQRVIDIFDADGNGEVDFKGEQSLKINFI